KLNGDSAKKLSDRFGKILQEKESHTLCRGEPSVNKSNHLDMAIPSSKISSLSTGEFVGSVADNHNCKIELKNFHADIQNDHKALAKEQQAYLPIPKVRTMKQGQVNHNYQQIRQEVQELVSLEMNRLLQDPGLKHLVVTRG